MAPLGDHLLGFGELGRGFGFDRVILGKGRTESEKDGADAKKGRA